jgi:REP-associated tyrosine transposase
MARLRRYTIPGLPQHVIQRGNNRGAIFFGPGDREVLLEWLAQAADDFGLAVHAYVLMPNHLHLLATPAAPDSLSRTMQSLGRRYVRYVNQRYRRTGTLWEGRFRSTVIDSERYLLACTRYIDLNPVRAGLTEAPQDFEWSSYRCLGLGAADPLLTPHPLYLALGGTAPKRRAAYRALCRQALPNDDIEALRRATNGGWALGDRAFRDRVAASSGRRTTPLERGRRPAAIDRA